MTIPTAREERDLAVGKSKLFPDAVPRPVDWIHERIVVPWFIGRFKGRPWNRLRSYFGREASRGGEEGKEAEIRRWEAIEKGGEREREGWNALERGNRSMESFERGGGEGGRIICPMHRASEPDGPLTGANWASGDYRRQDIKCLPPLLALQPSARYLDSESGLKISLPLRILLCAGGLRRNRGDLLGLEISVARCVNFRLGDGVDEVCQFKNWY